MFMDRINPLALTEICVQVVKQIQGEITEVAFNFCCCQSCHKASIIIMWLLVVVAVSSMIHWLKLKRNHVSKFSWLLIFCFDCVLALNAGTTCVNCNQQGFLSKMLIQLVLTVINGDFCQCHLWTTGIFINCD